MARSGAAAVEVEVVNLGELSFLSKVSTTTLGKLIRENDDFPITSRGDNGVAYEFPAKAALQWLQDNSAARVAADESRRGQLELMRRDLYGEPAEDDGTLQLSAAERKAEADAQYALDRNRRIRGELVDTAVLEGLLSNAVIKLRNELRQIPAAFVRKHGLSREQRLDLESMITARLNALAAALGTEEQYADDIATAA